jgi:uncharacterized membrane protein
MFIGMLITVFVSMFFCMLITVDFTFLVDSNVRAMRMNITRM